MPKQQMWILFSLILFLYVYPSEILAQSVQGKKHFEIIGSDSEYNDSLLREALNNYAFLDAIRFEHSRRIVDVEGAELKVQLFSLEELGKLAAFKARNALTQAELPSGAFIFSMTPRGKLKLISQ